MKDAVIYTQKLDVASVAILWGGFQTLDPAKWMYRMSLQYCGCNPHNAYLELVPNNSFYLRISPRIILSGINDIPFNDYDSIQFPTIKVYQHSLCDDGNNGQEIGEIIIIEEQNVDQYSTKNLQAVQTQIIKNAKYKQCSVFVDEHADNPSIRIIILGIESLPFKKFNKQRVPTLTDLGQIFHEIIDEEISSFAYITRDWLSYISHLSKAEKQVNEDTLRYLLCDYWERRISGDFASEVKYQRFPTREMDIQWVDKSTKYLMEIKYVSPQTDTTKELRRIFDDIYRLSWEKKELQKLKSNTKVRCLFVIFGSAPLFESHFMNHVALYSRFHPKAMFYKGKKSYKEHILEACFSFNRGEPKKQINHINSTEKYYQNFNKNYEDGLPYEAFTTDLLELILADDIYDERQHSIAIWEVDRDSLETEGNA